MARQVNIGALVRRGAEAISVNALVALAENPAALKEVCAELDSRAEVARELERSTQAASAALDVAKADHATAVAGGLAALEAERSAAAEQYADDMEELRRVGVEVDARVRQADERERGLDARAGKLARGTAEFADLTTRLKALSIESQEG